MNLDEENHIFNIGDQTALVCMTASASQKTITAQLADLNYKVHLGLFEEDVLLKLSTYCYDVVVIEENFRGAKEEENPILREMVKRVGAMRREHFVVLLSQHLLTNDAMCAFVHSVDQIVNFADLANFKPVVRRAVAQHGDLYRPFLDAIKSAQAG
jgi:hypothetical protein